MPWKVSHLVNQRVTFMSRLEAGEKMTDLCAEFGISRKTGYKFWQRFQNLGPEGLVDVSRRPRRLARLTSVEIQSLILGVKAEHPTWGAVKILEVLRRRNVSESLPSRSSIHALLERKGLITKRGRRRHLATQALHMGRCGVSQASNDLWCADYKGQFRLGDRSYCYPLTITDHYSRYILACEALDDTKGTGARWGFDAAFREFGLPSAIWTDNGAPFASQGLFGLSALSIWWLKLGIKVERSEPGHPEQNGRHERMHLTLKQETTRPSGANQLVQQEKFDAFVTTFNDKRPHEGLALKTPADVYQPSSKKYDPQMDEPDYPFHDITRRVMRCGHIRINAKAQIFLGRQFGDEMIGFREEDDQLWKVSFAAYDLGLFDERNKQFSPFEALRPSWS